MKAAITTCARREPEVKEPQYHGTASTPPTPQQPMGTIKPASSTDGQHWARARMRRRAAGANLVRPGRAERVQRHGDRKRVVGVGGDDKELMGRVGQQLKLEHHWLLHVS
jgi:hypothetical protein